LNQLAWHEDVDYYDDDDDDDDDASDHTFVLSSESEAFVHDKWKMHRVRFFLQSTTRLLVVGLSGDDSDGSGIRGANKPIIGLRVAYRLGATDAQ
jgi:hypothetical protein